MSRQTKFTLMFPKGLLSFKISLWKSTDAQTGFSSTYEERQIRMLKVLAKNDAKPKDISDIEKIVPCSETVPAYSYKDEETGEAKLLFLDEKVKCSIYKKSEYMTGIGFLDANVITPNMYAGDHYFIQVQKESKAPTAAEADVQGYSLLYYLLDTHKKVFLTKFVSGDREKFSIIYAVGDGLMLSTLIHNNYQREPPTVSRIPLPKAEAHAAKLIEKFSLREFDPSTTNDMYEQSIIRYIEELKRIAKSGATGKVKVTVKAPAAVAKCEDFFDKLDAL